MLACSVVTLKEWVLQHAAAAGARRHQDFNWRSAALLKSFLPTLGGWALRHAAAAVGAAPSAHLLLRRLPRRRRLAGALPPWLRRLLRRLDHALRALRGRSAFGTE